MSAIAIFTIQNTTFQTRTNKILLLVLFLLCLLRVRYNKHMTVSYTIQSITQSVQKTFTQSSGLCLSTLSRHCPLFFGLTVPVLPQLHAVPPILHIKLPFTFAIVPRFTDGTESEREALETWQNVATHECSTGYKVIVWTAKMFHNYLYFLRDLLRWQSFVFLLLFTRIFVAVIKVYTKYF